MLHVAQLLATLPRPFGVFCFQKSEAFLQIHSEFPTYSSSSFSLVFSQARRDWHVPGWASDISKQPEAGKFFPLLIFIRSRAPDSVGLKV